MKRWLSLSLVSICMTMFAATGDHGSMYENDIPLIIYGYQGELPSPDRFEMNYDLTRWLINTVSTGV